MNNQLQDIHDKAFDVARARAWTMEQKVLNCTQFGTTILKFLQ